MSKKKEEIDEKKVVSKKKPQKTSGKKKPQEEKISVLMLVAELKLDTGLVAGALNSKGLYSQFIKGLQDPNEELKLTKTEFEKIIDEFENGEL